MSLLKGKRGWHLTEDAGHIQLYFAGGAVPDQSYPAGMLETPGQLNGLIKEEMLKLSDETIKRLIKERRDVLAELGLEVDDTFDSEMDDLSLPTQTLPVMGNILNPGGASDLLMETAPIDMGEFRARFGLKD